MKTKYLPVLFAAFLFAAFLVAAPFVAAQDEGPENPLLPPFPAPSLADLAAQKAVSVVSLKCVLKVQIMAMGQNQEEEKNLEVPGVLVNDKGLVLTANTHFEGGLPPAVKRMLAQMGQEVETRATPSDLTVRFGSEIEEYEARLVARDSTLDLAFVQILDLDGREITHVDMRAGGDPGLGDELFGVTRMGKGFDYAVRIGRLYVDSAIARPRRMWSVQGQFAGIGHPVYNRGGFPVGVMSVQEGSEGVSDEGGGMFGMLGAAENILTVVLPREDVLRSVASAERRAEEMFAELAAENEGGSDEGGDAPEGPGEDAPEDPGEDE